MLRIMTRSRLTTILCVLGIASVAAAQAKPQPAQATPPPTEVLHAGTQLVIVDVVVEDRGGHPIHSLTRDNFLVTEQKKPQTVRNFEEHSSASATPAGPELPPMPPGTFTDYTPVAPDGTLNILLIDTLNTPMKDQMFVRQQLLDYVKHARPGMRVAIFGLSSRLYMLQGFTSDPAVLKGAVEHHLIARASSLLDDPVGSGATPQSMSDMASDLLSGPDAASIIANLQQFEAQNQAFQTQLRIQYTLDAFNDLGHYLANFPGRKNLIWFSGSFPIDIMPDPDLNSPFAVMETNDDEFRQTTNLLAQAQVAVYPIDARGLMTAPMFDASRSGSNYVRNPSAFGKDLTKFNAAQANEHMTMDQLANDTGGHAFYNTNGLADAAAKALDAGANYYTLTYTPTDHNWNGAYRNIHVQLNGSPAAQQLVLSYRHGYYADDPYHPAKHAIATTSAITPADTADRAAEAYTRAALSRGAPAPADILFKVRVLPASATTQSTLAPNNTPNPNGQMKAPYRQFAVDVAAVAANFSLTPQPDGRHSGQISVDALIYNPDGLLLNASGRTVSLNLTPQMYKSFRSATGVEFHLDVSVPARQESFLRLVVRDVPTNRYGVVEIPISQVSRLAPVPQSAAPAASPSKASPPASASPAGSTARTGAKQ
jgi:VWFA-related protein